MIYCSLPVDNFTVGDYPVKVIIAGEYLRVSHAFSEIGP